MHELLKTKLLKVVCASLPAMSASTQGVRDWLIEYSFVRLICSAWADYLIQHTPYFFMGSLLLQLRDLEDFFGLIKAILPALLYAGMYAASALIKHLRKYHEQRLSSREI